MTLNMIQNFRVFLGGGGFEKRKFRFFFSHVEKGLPVAAACKEIYVLPVSFRRTVALGWRALARNSPSDYAKLIYLKRRNPGYKWGDEPPLSCVFMCAPFSRAPRNAACARFHRLIHKFLMNTRLIRLCIRPYAATGACLCARVHSADRAQTVPVRTCHTYSRVHLHYPSLERMTQLTCLLLARF